MKLRMKISKEGQKRSLSTGREKMQKLFKKSRHLKMKHEDKSCWWTGVQTSTKKQSNEN